MTPSTKDLPAYDSGASVDAKDESRSDVRAGVFPVNSGEPVPCITDEQLRDLVTSRPMQESIARVVKARLERGAPKALVDDLVQDAILATLSAKPRPPSMASAARWVSRVTVRTVANYYRRDEAHRTWLDREAGVEGRGVWRRRRPKWLILMMFCMAAVAISAWLVWSLSRTAVPGGSRPDRSPAVPSGAPSM